MYIFIDSSVILSFCRSKKGASALILDYCRIGKLKGYISQKVVFEVKNNNRKDEDELGKLRFTAVLKQKFLKIIEDPSQEALEEAHRSFDNEKDAPIIAAAKQIPHLSYILSLDNGFFKPEVISYVKPIEIVKPGEFIQRYRKELKKS